MPPYLSVPFPGHGSLEQVAAPEQGIFAVPALDGQDGFLELVLPSPDIHRTGLPDKKIRFSPQDRQAFRVPHMLRIQADFPDQQMRIRNPSKRARVSCRITCPEAVYPPGRFRDPWAWTGTGLP